MADTVMNSSLSQYILILMSAGSEDSLTLLKKSTLELVKKAKLRLRAISFQIATRLCGRR